MDIKVEKCPAYHDNRGDLIQFLTNQNLLETSLPFGQVYLLTFSKPGMVRGNHYHNHSSEMFCLISGTVEMLFEDVVTKQRWQQIFTAEKNDFFRVSIQKRIAHSIKSISEFAVMVSFSSIEYVLTEDDKIPYPLT